MAELVETSLDGNVALLRDMGADLGFEVVHVPLLEGVSSTAVRRLVEAGDVAAAAELLGRAVGSQWPSWRNHLEYVDYAALGLLIVVVAFLIYRHVHRVRAARDRTSSITAR